MKFEIYFDIDDWGLGFSISKPHKCSGYTLGIWIDVLCITFGVRIFKIKELKE